MELKINELLELIREQVELFEGKTEEGESPPLEEWLPTIRITEEWGKIESPSREQLKLFVNQITSSIKAETTFERRIKTLASFVKGKPELKSVAQIFARIMMLELLTAIAEEFTESAGGFILEALCAALAGPKYQQVTKDTTDGGPLPIVDFTDGEIHYSLKLLRGDPEGLSSPSGNVKGSIYNLLEHLAGENGDNCDTGKSVRYVVAYRDGESLKFVGFDITCKNVGKLMAQKDDKFNGEAFGLKSDDVEGKTAQDLFSRFRNISTTPSPSASVGGDDNNEEGNNSENTKPKKQFSFTRKQIMTAADANPAIIGSIPIGRDTLKKVADRYADDLKEKLIPLYKDIKGLTDNTNRYFLHRKESTRKQAADEIINIVYRELPNSIDQTGMYKIEDQS